MQVGEYSRVVRILDQEGKVLAKLEWILKKKLWST